jgi:hypothetical protein
MQGGAGKRDLQGCRKLGSVPATGDQRLSLFRSAIREDFSDLRTSSGKPIPALVRAANRSKRARTRALAVLPKALAWADTLVRRETALSHAGVGCGAPAGNNSAKIGEFTISLSTTGDLSVSANLPNGYRIEIFLGKAVPGCTLDLPECATADGTLDGKDSHLNTITSKVTQNGQVVQSVSIVVRSTQTMRGKVADDAKLETLDIQDTSREDTTVVVPGARARLVLTVRRSTVVDMRSGGPRPGSTTVNARLQEVGATQTFQTAVDPAVVRKYTEDFKEIISEEVRNYRSRESAWQSPGKCAKATFDPPSGGSTKLKLGENGTVTAKVESNQGGVAAKGKWKVTSMANGSFSPPTADGGSAPFQYVVTKAGDGIRLAGTFRATSTAGVAEGSWSQPTEADNILHFRVLAASYEENSLGQGDPPGAICALAGVSTSFSQKILGNLLPPAFEATNQLTFAEDGSAVGQIAATGEGTVTGTMSGCDILTMPPPACSQPYSGAFQIAPSIQITIQPRAQTATVVWPLPPLGPNVPGGNPACLFGIPRDLGNATPATRTIDLGTLIAPGDRTVTLSHSRMGTAPGVSVSSTVSASLTFRRVKEDGSPYPG